MSPLSEFPTSNLLLPSSLKALASLANLVGLTAAGRLTSLDGVTDCAPAGVRPTSPARAALTVIRRTPAWASGCNVAAGKRRASKISSARFRSCPAILP